MGERPIQELEYNSREIHVSAGTLFVHKDGEMTHVVLDPSVRAGKSGNKLRITRWFQDQQTGEHYWLYSDQELVNPRHVGEIISTLTPKELRIAGRLGAQMYGSTLSELVEQEITEAVHKGQITYTV